MRKALALFILCLGLASAGCQTWSEGMTAPSPQYLQSGPVCIPVNPAMQQEIQVLRGAMPAAEVAPSNPLSPGNVSAAKELEQALQEQREALAAFRVALRALEASQNRLDALAKKGPVNPPALARPTATLEVAPPPISAAISSTTPAALSPRPANQASPTNALPAAPPVAPETLLPPGDRPATSGTLPPPLPPGRPPVPPLSVTEPTPPLPPPQTPKSPKPSGTPTKQAVPPTPVAPDAMPPAGVGFPGTPAGSSYTRLLGSALGALTGSRIEAKKPQEPQDDMKDLLRTILQRLEKMERRLDRLENPPARM